MRQTSGVQWVRDYVTLRYRESSSIYLACNPKNIRFFRDIRVLQAIAHAIDKREILQGVLFWQGVAETGSYKLGIWAYNTNTTL